MNQREFVNAVVNVARQQGYDIENSRNGRQINFGHKKLHEGHLRELYPDILADSVNIAGIIESVAPGRPCTHRPMRKILAIIRAK